jgi:hypothetical protein
MDRRTLVATAAAAGATVIAGAGAIALNLGILDRSPRPVGGFSPVSTVQVVDSQSPVEPQSAGVTEPTHREVEHADEHEQAEHEQAEHADEHEQAEHDYEYEGHDDDD